MVQLTSSDGSTKPLSFEHVDECGKRVRVHIDKVVGVISIAEQKSGTVGDRYECIIDGRTIYLYYGRIVPRIWFMLRDVSREEYEAYYDIDKPIEYAPAGDARRINTFV
jgi:hypothetical protein